MFNEFYCCSTHTETPKQNNLYVFLLFSVFFLLLVVFLFEFFKLECRHETNEKKNCAQNIFHYVIFEHATKGRGGVAARQG